MKRYLSAAALFITCASHALAQSSPPTALQSALTKDAVGAVKSILASPEAAAAFSANSQLMSVTIVQKSGQERVFNFEGKRLRPGGFRNLFITEKRGFTGDVGVVTFTPVLAP